VSPSSKDSGSCTVPLQGPISTTIFATPFLRFQLAFLVGGTLVLGGETGVSGRTSLEGDCCTACLQCDMWVDSLRCPRDVPAMSLRCRCDRSQ